MANGNCILADVPSTSLPLAAANASPRAQRSAILASPLHELTGFCLEVDCLAEGCRQDRMFAVSGRSSDIAIVLSWNS